MTIFGVDCSDYDWDRGPMDVAAMARDGISFLTHKATEGTRVRHAHYRDALDRARAARIPVLGAYVVPRTPGNGGHGYVAQQVDYFLSYLDSQTPWWRTHPAFILQVDLEHWEYDKVGTATGVAVCDLLKARTGKTVVLYAPQWAYGDTIGGSHALWASDYGTNPAINYRSAYPGDSSGRWRDYSGRTPLILQFGSRLRVGNQPGMDVNAFRGSVADLLRVVGAASRTESMTQAAATTTSTEDDDMAGGIPTTEIPLNGGSFNIWPVNSGAAGHGPAWFNVGNDTFGADYGLRVWGSKGDGSFFPLGNGSDGVLTLKSGQRFSVTLPDGTSILTISRIAPKGGTVYSGHLSFCVEYGKRG